MIGVIPKAHQLDVVEEFFELFKTPWEFYRPDRVYDVILATADEVPEGKAKLLLVYGSATKSIDAQMGMAAHGRQQRALLSDRDLVFPVYGELLTFAPGSSGVPCITAGSDIAGVTVGLPGFTLTRLGYDLFEEVRFLFSAGQPIEYAHIPTLEIHIRMLKEWMVGAGLTFLEIPPAPAGNSFVVCLTHDIDFVGIRNHRFDHSMWGFVYRATVGSLRNFLRGRLALKRVVKNWFAAASVPFVYAGWVKDFWEPFEWYLEVEKGLPATYFLIPFKRCPGERVPGKHASRRATAYDVTDLPHWTATLQSEGCELGVHGIDAWHSADKGRDELARIADVTRESGTGIRVHWLLSDPKTPSIMEQAGYAYDSTVGYNETIGYRAGTSQVFRPLGANTLLELPLHIQDGALFYPERLDLSGPEAIERCQGLIDNVRKFGGVLTLLWHDRSHAPERFWGDTYVGLLGILRSLDGWFGTAAQVVNWFRKRREVRFGGEEAPGGTGARLRYQGEEIQPPLRLRICRPLSGRHDSESVREMQAEIIDIPWNGTSVAELDAQIAASSLRAS